MIHGSRIAMRFQFLSGPLARDELGPELNYISTTFTNILIANITSQGWIIGGQVSPSNIFL